MIELLEKLVRMVDATKVEDWEKDTKRGIIWTPDGTYTVWEDGDEILGEVFDVRLTPEETQNANTGTMFEYKNGEWRIV